MERLGTLHEIARPGVRHIKLAGEAGPGHLQGPIVNPWETQEVRMSHPRRRDRGQIVATIAEGPGTLLGHAPNPHGSMQGLHQKFNSRKS